MSFFRRWTSVFFFFALYHRREIHLPPFCGFFGLSLGHSIYALSVESACCSSKDFELLLASGPKKERKTSPARRLCVPRRSRRRTSFLLLSSHPLFFQIKKTPTLFQLSNRPRRPLALHGRLHLPRVHPFYGVRLRRARLPPHGKGRQRGLDQVPAPRGAARPGRPDLGRRRRRRARAVRRVLPRGFLFLGCF